MMRVKKTQENKSYKFNSLKMQIVAEFVYMYVEPHENHYCSICLSQ